MTIEGKAAIASILIKKALREYPGKCAVACSFGKDSEIVLHMVLKEDPGIKVVFCNTGIEFKDTLLFRDRIVKEWGLNFYEARPVMPFGAIIRKYGLPKARTSGTKSTHGQRVPKCCYYLKDLPAIKLYRELDVKCIFTGISAEESRNRFMLSCRMGNYYFNRKERLQKCHPLMNWTEADVWEYIRANNLPYNAHYDKFPGHRVGCAPCTAYTSWMERMPVESPKWYKIIQKMRGQTLFDEIGEDEEEVPA